ncbi:D-alanyl-D-alanine carboxypeptidase family protein [Zongyangia hominis]|uniref:serine-type D-Ala-D-Ala carboxypeptidase n=1 Tax=Zongyangia hominis TaxID=2763677 RepID=A0A926I7B8_9FIRM|nr:D-alanyl-D-alanine carboxypeptidase family protein [Zongyangia hominis]MBC8570929.1 D-alanyl-D-alanine carboxypeptidase [Zongyangia hominis]
MLKKWLAAVTAALLLAASFPLGACAFTPDAKGAVVIEMESGRVLYSLDGEEQLPMASTTKIMTALLTLEQPDLDRYFEVDASAIQVEGSSMGLCAGDQVTLRVLAYGMLLSSGNDAAGAAAVRIAGSEEAFVRRMNERAREMGLTNTHFVTPSGLDGEGHYSTAHDMALLARVALQNPDFAQICGTYRAKVEYGNPPYARWLKNHNKLLDICEGTIGVKTGFTKVAGRCLVSAVERDGVGLICVTLGAADDWNVHQKLYEEYFKALPLRNLDQSAAPQSVPVVGGGLEEVSVAPAAPSQAPLTDEELARVERRVEISPFLYAPVAAGQVAGNLVYTLDGAEICRTALVTQESAAALQVKPKESFWGKIWNWLTGGNKKTNEESAK